MRLLSNDDKNANGCSDTAASCIIVQSAFRGPTVGNPSVHLVN